MGEPSADYNMPEPELQEACAKLRAWDASKDPHGCMAFLKSKWWSADWGWSEGAYEDGIERGWSYRISTGGWSDNEALMAALEDNDWFWTFFWESSRRGGHFEFRVGASWPKPPPGCEP